MSGAPCSMMTSYGCCFDDGTSSSWRPLLRVRRWARRNLPSRGHLRRLSGQNFLPGRKLQIEILALPERVDVLLFRHVPWMLPRGWTYHGWTSSIVSSFIVCWKSSPSIFLTAGRWLLGRLITMTIKLMGNEKLPKQFCRKDKCVLSRLASIHVPPSNLRQRGYVSLCSSHDGVISLLSLTKDCHELHARPVVQSER